MKLNVTFTVTRVESEEPEDPIIITREVDIDKDEGEVRHDT